MLTCMFSFSPVETIVRVLAALALASTLTGCQSSLSGARISHEEGHGPLSGFLGSGLSGLNAPDKVPWWGTFGDAILCSTTGKAITLERVRYDVKIKPFAIRTGIRTVNPGANEMTTGKRRGRPPWFTTKPHRMTGTYRESVAGVVVRRRCAAKPDGGFQEIVTSMEFGRRGGWVTGMSVDYSTEGKEYRLHLGWDYLGCGTAITDSGLC